MYITKSLKVRRAVCYFKKFQIKANQYLAQAKTFTKQKLSLAKTFATSVVAKAVRLVQVRLGRAKATVLELPKNPKAKPKPLSGVKLKYELLPIRK